MSRADFSASKRKNSSGLSDTNRLDSPEAATTMNINVPGTASNTEDVGGGADRRTSIGIRTAIAMKKAAQRFAKAIAATVTTNDDNNEFGKFDSAPLQPLSSSSSSFHPTQSMRHRKSSVGLSLPALQREDTFLGGSSGGANTLRKIFSEADAKSVGFLTPDQTFGALKVVGVSMKLHEMHEMLDEIDVNDVDSENLEVRDASSLRAAGAQRSFHLGDLLHLNSSASSAEARPQDDGELSLSRSQNDEPLPDMSSSAMLAATMMTTSSAVSSKKQRRRRNRRIVFEDFEKIIELWQSAARFQLFEKRNEETEARLKATTERKFLSTDSGWMWTWQCIMLFVGCYLVMVPVAVFTNTEAEMAQYFALYTPFDAIVTVLLLADMALKCCCCVTTQINGVSMVVDDWKGIVREYTRSHWFWIDLLVLLPWRFSVFVGGDTTYLMQYDNSTGVLINADQSGCVGCRTIEDYRFAVDVAIVLLLVRALKFLEHYQYFAETGLTPLTHGYIRRQYVVGMGFIQAARFAVLVHMLAVIYMSLYQYTTKLRDTDGDGSDSSEGDLTSFPRYAEALYLVLVCMATVGYGDVVPRNDMERGFFMCLIIIGWLFNAYVIGSLVGFFQASDIDSERQSKLLELSTLLEHFEVPESLTLEILSFEDYLLSNSIKKSFGHIVNDLPLDMQRNVELWNRVKVINNIAFFHSFHKSAKLQICNVLVEITFCPEDYVYMIGELGTEMFFVNHGFVDILDHNSDWMATKKAGDSFGEIGAFELNSMQRSEDAKCLTYCEFFVLAKEPLLEVRQRYPRVQRQVDMFCNDQREREMSKLDLAMSVRYCSLTAGGGGIRGGGVGTNPVGLNQLKQQQTDGDDGQHAQILPDGQFGLGFGDETAQPQQQDDSPRRNSFASVEEQDEEHVLAGTHQPEIFSVRVSGADSVDDHTRGPEEQPQANAYQQPASSSVTPHGSPDRAQAEPAPVPLSAESSEVPAPPLPQSFSNLGNTVYTSASFSYGSNRSQPPPLYTSAGTGDGPHKTPSARPLASHTADRHPFDSPALMSSSLLPVPRSSGDGTRRSPNSGTIAQRKMQQRVRPIGLEMLNEDLMVRSQNSRSLSPASTPLFQPLEAPAPLASLAVPGGGGGQGTGGTPKDPNALRVRVSPRHDDVPQTGGAPAGTGGGAVAARLRLQQQAEFVRKVSLPSMRLAHGGLSRASSSEQLRQRMDQGSSLIPSLLGGNQSITPTGRGGCSPRPSVHFTGVDDSATELFPAQGNVSGEFLTTSLSPLTLQNVSADDWNTLRGEVSRLKHASLVEVVMQCLGDALDVHELLQQATDVEGEPSTAE